MSNFREVKFKGFVRRAGGDFAFIDLSRTHKVATRRQGLSAIAMRGVDLP
jgi:hypothetical protein